MHWFAKYKIESAASHRSLAHSYLGMAKASEVECFKHFYRASASRQLLYGIDDIRSAKRFKRQHNAIAAE